MVRVIAGAIRSALARPTRKGAQLLFLPNRERLKAEFKAAMARESDKESLPVLAELSEIELSIVETLATGRAKCLTCCCWDVNGQVLDLNFVMPMSANSFDDYVVGARRLGVQAQQHSAKIAMKRLMSDEALGAK